ncbi:hypothetical protein OF83DRAFT_1083592, partial [Amylostereum chailletii]
IVPAFAFGYKYPDGRGTSSNVLADDGDDYNTYYQNHFVERDLLMRHHWGLGVGHTYSHGCAPTAESFPNSVPTLRKAYEVPCGRGEGDKASAAGSDLLSDLLQSLPRDGRDEVETDEMPVVVENDQDDAEEGEGDPDSEADEPLEFIGTYD